jgi:hypothetical protein
MSARPRLRRGHDTAPETTVLRAANYDHLDGCVFDDGTNACLAASDIAALDLPPSLYRSGKPGWFGSLAWPPLGPDVTGETSGANA